MINTQRNNQINEKLKALYKKNAAEFLVRWERAFAADIKNENIESAPCRINEFGIIDVNQYDSDEGILFICRETNGWKNVDYEFGCLFKEWMYNIIQGGLPKEGHVKKHPNMWYNIGRWTILLTEEGRPMIDIAETKEEAIKALGKIAFTNINKVRGKASAKKEYYRLASDPFVKELLKKEIEIIAPKIIVCCGTYDIVCDLLEDFSGNLFAMPHPSARKNKINMLVDLNKQRRRQKIGLMYK